MFVAVFIVALFAGAVLPGFQASGRRFSPALYRILTVIYPLDSTWGAANPNHVGRVTVNLASLAIWSSLMGLLSTLTVGRINRLVSRHSRARYGQRTSGSRGHFNRRRVLSILLLCSLLLVLASLLLPATSAARDVGPDESCKRRLGSIHEALTLYRTEHDDCPSVVLGPQGRQHSWRIAAMQGLFRDYHARRLGEYRFDELWNSPHNRQVTRSASLQAFLSCRLESNRRRDYAFTSYLMLVRPEVEGKSPPPSPSAVVVVESAGCGVEFAAPQDIQWESLWEGASPFGPGKLDSLHPFLVRALCCDGTVIEIPKDMVADDVKSLLNGHYRPDTLWPGVAIAVLVSMLICTLWVIVVRHMKK